MRRISPPRDPESFYLIGIQSPAFHAGSQIYPLFSEHPVRDVRIHMSWGTIRDVGDAGERMEAIMAGKGYMLDTVVLNEGHSWGSWRATLDDMFEYFWGAASNVAVEEALPRSTWALESFPNPTSGVSTVRFVLAGPGEVRLRVFDLLGRVVETVLDASLPPGSVHARWDASSVPAGTYLFRLEVRGRVVESRVIAVR